MDQIASLVKIMYEQFLLRDVLAKLTPGSIFLGTIAICTFGVEGVKTSMSELNLFVWLILFGITWLTGIAIQGFGEMISLIHYFPKKEVTEDYPVDFLSSTIRIQNAKQHEFSKRSDEKMGRRRERFTVIKEAAGNMYVAVILSALVFLFSYPCEIFGVVMNWKQLVSYIPQIFGFIVIVSGLCFMHFAHVRRQYEYTKFVIENCQTIDVQSADIEDVESSDE